MASTGEVRCVSAQIPGIAPDRAADNRVGQLTHLRLDIVVPFASCALRQQHLDRVRQHAIAEASDAPVSATSGASGDRIKRKASSGAKNTRPARDGRTMPSILDRDYHDCDGIDDGRWGADETVR